MIVLNEKIEILKCLSQPIRLEIIYILSEEKKSVSQIIKELDDKYSNVEYSNVIHHLTKLHNLKLIKKKRSGKTMTYCLKSNDVIDLLEDIEEISKKIRQI